MGAVTFSVPPGAGAGVTLARLSGPCQSLERGSNVPPIRESKQDPKGAISSSGNDECGSYVFLCKPRLWSGSTVARTLSRATTERTKVAAASAAQSELTRRKRGHGSKKPDEKGFRELENCRAQALRGSSPRPSA